jgi:hypothetical protein
MGKEVRLRQGWADVDDLVATTEVADDTTPQLGGDLDLNTHDITGAGDIDITGAIDATGTITGATFVAGTPIAVASGGTGQTTAAEAVGELTQALSHQDAIDRMADLIPSYDASGDSGESLFPYEVAGMAVLAAGTASGVAALDLALDTAGYSAFSSFEIRLSGIVPATDGSSLFLRVSDDSGSTFEADASDYAWVRTDAALSSTPSVSPTGDGADSEIELTPGLGNAADELSSLTITIRDPAATQVTHFNWSGLFTNTTTVRFNIWGGGASLAAAAVTDIRLIMSAGNLTCKYTLVGFI